jgi:hypothetical protein
MTYQILNQSITIKQDKTEIKVLNDGKPTFYKKLKFSLLNYPVHQQAIKQNNLAEHYWLANLFIQIKEMKAVQLTIQF